MTTIYDDLVAQGLGDFILRVDEIGGGVEWKSGMLLNVNQLRISSDILWQHTNPTAYANMIAARNRLASAKTAVVNHPWAAYTQADWTTWYNLHLADSIVDGFSIPAGVKTYLKDMSHALSNVVSFLIYLRDLLISGLPDGQINISQRQQL